MMPTSKFLLLAMFTSVLAACGNNSDQNSAVNKVSELASTATNTTIKESVLSVKESVLSVDSFRPSANIAAQESTMKPRDLSTAPVTTNISLGTPLSSQAEIARKNNETLAADHMGKPLQIGFGRGVAQTATASATNQLLKWQVTKSGGQVAAINFSSTGAKGMRVGLLVNQLPETATLRFYAKGATTAFEVTGAEVLEILARNLAAGDKTDDGRTYWSPVIKANNGTAEIEIPADIDTNAVKLSIPIITHLFMSMSEAQSVFAQSTYDATDINRTGNVSQLACQVDVKCSLILPAASDAVAWLVYNQSGGYANICSGTLLNDAFNSGTPNLLTANHCISTQTYASNLYTEFKYRSLACDNAATGEYFPTAAIGARLLYTAYNTDSTLLRLNGTPSTSVLYAGWDATTAPANSTSVHSVHHPRGDQQRLSRGSITGYATRNAVNPNLFSGSDITNGTILNVTLTTGLTEGGSSGSGLFKGTDVNPILIGQLFGGSTPGNASNGYMPACFAATPPTKPLAMPPNNVYGRFDVAFHSGMNDWLAPTGRKVKYDYNASGKSDIVWTGLSSGGTFLQIGQPLTTPKLLVNTGISTVHSGDFNGDGHADIVYTSANGQQIEVVLLKNGYRMSSQFHSPSSSWPLAGVGDFDGDGKSDLIFRNPTTGQIIYWLMNGVSVKTNSGPKPVSQYWFIKGVGDVNGDGKDDVVWMNPWTGEQAIHIMNGTSYTLAGYQFVATAWEIHGVGDLNGDGKADIIWRYPLTGQVFIYFMNGGTITSTASYGVAPSWKIRQIGDYDGDGKSDVLWQNENTGTLVVHHMNGGAIKSTVTHQLDESLVKIQ
jgi:lysyl endopeptidase